MERKQFLLMIAGLLLVACNEVKKETAAATQTYTCPMHPQVVQHKPGTCPICAMDLVPFDKNNQEASLTLSEGQMQLANITTVTLGSAALSNSRQLNGRLVTDPAATVIISSRVAGRVETLYIKETGVRVTKGQPLYKIYSEQLATLQQEYLLAAAQVKQFPDDARFAQIEKAARQKLLLYDQSDAQIQQLVQAQKVNAYVTYPATANGMVASLAITEGQYVAEGGMVMQLEDYSKLWVEADVYPAEASAIHIGQSLQVIIPGWEHEPQTATVQFINPSLQSGSQLLQVRGTVNNPGKQWQPGLQAKIMLPVLNKSNALSLPADAVIRDGKGMHVWLKTAKGKFEPRMVRTGIENADVVEITEGLQAGDEVVVTGAYLLYSEYILKKGTDPNSIKTRS